MVPVTERVSPLLALATISLLVEASALTLTSAVVVPLTVSTGVTPSVLTVAVVVAVVVVVVAAAADVAGVVPSVISTRSDLMYPVVLASTVI